MTACFIEYFSKLPEPPIERNKLQLFLSDKPAPPRRDCEHLQFRTEK